VSIRHYLIAVTLICPSLAWAEAECRDVTDDAGKSVRYCKSATGQWLVNPSAVDYQEGKHFMEITPPQRDDGSVLLFGSMACSECYAERRNLEEFRKDNPTIKLTLVPVMWGFDSKRNLDYDAYARAELISGILGGTWPQQISDALGKFTKVLRSEADVRPLFLGLGCDAQLFDKAESSFAFQAQLRRAQQATRTFRIGTAPAYVVKGKYLVPLRYYDSNGTQLLNREKLTSVVAYLLDK